MPKGIPASGKRRPRAKRGPQKKYAGPVRKKSAAKVKRSTVKRSTAKRKAAPATRTSAKSIVLEKFDGFERQLNRMATEITNLTVEVKVVSQALRAQLIDAWKAHTQAGGDVVSFATKYECSMNVIGLTEQDLEEYLHMMFFEGEEESNLPSPAEESVPGDDSTHTSPAFDIL